MSAYGTKQTYCAAQRMSAFGVRADILRIGQNVGFCPKADIHMVAAVGLRSSGAIVSLCRWYKKTSGQALYDQLAGEEAETGGDQGNLRFGEFLD